MSAQPNVGDINQHLPSGSFYGEILHKRNYSGLILSEVSHSRPRRLPRHSHELAYFCLLLDGHYAEYFGRKEISYKPWTIMFHPPEMVHRDEIGIDGGRFFSIEVGPQWLDLLRQYSATPPITFDLNGGELVWLAMRMYREYRSTDPSSQLAVQGLAMEMLAAVARSESGEGNREPTWLAKVLDFLHEEFKSNLSVGQIARQVGVHPCHLARVFRQFKRQTINEYVQGLRIQLACRQLASVDVELADLALMLGFADQSHFTRIFKQVTGTTPSALRRTLLNK